MRYVVDPTIPLIHDIFLIAYGRRVFSMSIGISTLI